MGVKTKVVDWFNKVIRQKTEKIFEYDYPISDEMESVVTQCANVYTGKPLWVQEDKLQTGKVAKIVCSEVSRLITLGLEVSITGSSRAEWLQSQIDTLFEDARLRTYIEYCMAYGTLAFKPNGEYIDIFKPNEFIITKERNGKVEGIIFIYKENDNDRYFTRFEYHKLEDEKVYVTNIAYEGKKELDLKKRINLEDVDVWDGISEDWEYERSEFFSILKVAEANNIDSDSALGLPIFANSLEELKNYDIGYTRWATEISDSEKIILLDSDRMLTAGKKFNPSGLEEQRKLMKLPHYVKNVMGDGASDFYQEINPQINTSVRLEGLNFLLSLIGYKCGFSGGYFNLNEKTGMVTATQVEADDRRTIELIKDNRNALEECLNSLIEALNNMADAYKIEGAGTGDYDVNYNFEDITHNLEEDRNRWYSYVISGQIPFWYFLVKFEGMTEEEAKELAITQPQLFGEPSDEPVDKTEEPKEEPTEPTKEEPVEEEKEVKK